MPNEANYNQKILDAIRQGPPLFGWNAGLFFQAGEGLIAKIFKDYDFGRPGCDSESSARKEYDNLKRIIELNDPRLKVPTPHAVVNLGTTTELEAISPSPSSLRFTKKPIREDGSCYVYPVFGTVMDYVDGPKLTEIGPDERKKYEGSLRKMIEAMLEHQILKGDIKAEEVICIKESTDVYLVDMHLIRWDLSLDDLAELARIYTLRILPSDRA